mmetsp:Transcript_5093/g.16317  ORF Transcript_5093/g.16317 Transcript_5093/m.16317 type:complete len:251 (+) Transcript_5093:168-920(+)
MRGAVAADDDVVLDAHADATAPRRQLRVVGWEVQPRLHSQRHARQQRLRLRRERRVVHVEAQVVPYVVRVVARDAVRLAGAEDAQLHERLVREPEGEVVQGRDRRAAVPLCCGDASLVHAQDGRIDVSLLGRESARQGPRAGDVGGVPAKGASRVHQQEVAWRQQRIVVHVVQRARAHPRGDHARVGEPPAAAQPRLVLEPRREQRLGCAAPRRRRRRCRCHSPRRRGRSCARSGGSPRRRRSRTRFGAA